MELTPRATTAPQKKYIEYLLSDTLDGYVATVDAPAIMLTPELMATYPEAIVIVTTRDPKSWWKSMELVNDMMGGWWIPWLVLFIPKLQVYGRWKNAIGALGYWRTGEVMLNAGSIERHEQQLREVVPPGKLFWYNVKEGWAPLCTFLGVPEPHIPMPRANEAAAAARIAEDITARVYEIWTLGIMVVVGGSVGVVGVGAAAWVAWRRGS